MGNALRWCMNDGRGIYIYIYIYTIWPLCIQARSYGPRIIVGRNHYFHLVRLSFSSHVFFSYLWRARLRTEDVWNLFLSNSRFHSARSASTSCLLSNYFAHEISTENFGEMKRESRGANVFCARKCCLCKCNNCRRERHSAWFQNRAGYTAKKLHAKCWDTGSLFHCALAVCVEKSLWS